MFATHALPRAALTPFPPAQSFWYGLATEGLYAGLALLFPPPRARLRARSNMRLHASQYADLARLMRAVKATTTPGVYVGANMTYAHTVLAAQMSGDHNDVHLKPAKPHPLFGKLIAHGMNAVSQSLVALRAEMDIEELVPDHMSISFLAPVFLNEDRLAIRVSKTTATAWDLVVMATNKRTQVERTVVRMSVRLKEGTPFGNDEWFRVHMTLWRISALIAETWPGCLYLKQELTIRRPTGSDIDTVVHGQGEDERGRASITTGVTTSGHSAWPSMSGKGTILLPAA